MIWPNSTICVIFVDLAKNNLRFYSQKKKKRGRENVRVASPPTSPSGDLGEGAPIFSKVARMRRPVSHLTDGNLHQVIVSFFFFFFWKNFHIREKKGRSNCVLPPPAPSLLGEMTGGFLSLQRPRGRRRGRWIEYHVATRVWCNREDGGKG